MVDFEPALPLSRPAEYLITDCYARRREHLKAGRPTETLPAFGLTDGEAEDLAWFLAQDRRLGEAKNAQMLRRKEILESIRAGEATLYGSRLVITPAENYSQKYSP